MELHLVHYNTEYGAKLSDAIAKGNGSYNTLAVLGIMFDIQKKDNPKLEPIVEGNLFIFQMANAFF